MVEIRRRCTQLPDFWLKDYEGVCLLTQGNSKKWSDFYEQSSSHYQSPVSSADLATFHGALDSSKTFLGNFWKLTQLDPGFKRKYGHDASSVGVIVFLPGSMVDTLGGSESVRTDPSSIPTSISKRSVGDQSGGTSKKDLITVVSHRLSGTGGKETNIDNV
jgi:hypothetical protein